jgi:hypothetical protein
MSKIVVIGRDVPSDRRAVAFARIRRITGKAISEISRNLRLGEPLVVENLFLNDHDEVAERLRMLLRELPTIGVRLTLFELPTGQDVDEMPPSHEEIQIEILENILNAHDDRKKARQKMQDEHGHA